MAEQNDQSISLLLPEKKNLSMRNHYGIERVGDDLGL